MHFRTCAVTALTLFTALGTASAAGLKDCVAKAEANSPAVKAYEQKLAAALAARERDRRAGLPKLSASAEDGYSSYSTDSGLANGFNGTLSLQLGWDLPKVLSGYQRLAVLETDKSRLLLEISRRALSRNIQKNYYRLYILAEKKADYAEAKAYFVSHIAAIEDLGDRGMDVQLDLLHANMQLRSLGVAAAGTESALKNELLALNSRTGGNFGESDFDFRDIPAPAEAAIPAGTAEAAPETRLNSLDLRSAEESYRQSGYFYAPALAFGVNKAVTPIDPAAERSRVFLSLSLDLFDFGSRAADRKSLLAESEARRASGLEDLRVLKLTLLQLQTAIRNAASACAAAGAGLQDADKAMKTADEYYRQGKIKETDLLSVFSDYLAAKEQARDALGDYLDKKADLDYAVEAI